MVGSVHQRRRRRRLLLGLHQMSRQLLGRCEHCQKTFSYALVHSGFNDSSYAYCDTCGMTAVLSHWHTEFSQPPNMPPDHSQVDSLRISRLKPCECGGIFKTGASPRCPNCRKKLSAELASTYIEGNAPGAEKGWRWQKNWQGLYCIIVEGKVINDNFRS